jgi:hypothetical protein
MSKPDYTYLFHWVREREATRIRKEAGEPQPWTDDPFISKWRFCNVRREDDRGTIWVRKHIREPFDNHPHLWLMLCIARQINWPDTLAELIASSDGWPHDERFDPLRMAQILDLRKGRGDKVYTGAYTITAPAEKGASKNLHIATNVIGAMWKQRDSFMSVYDMNSIQAMHSWLTTFKGFGTFYAYQSCVDMRFTPILRNASDVRTWAAAGPGSIRGLHRLYGRDYKKALSQQQALTEMRLIYDVVQGATGVEMDFSDVPNILCETDKYMRLMNGEGEPRAKFVPGRGY